MSSVLFVQDAWYEKLGVMSISSVLKAHGHQVRVLVGDGDRAQTLRSIRGIDPQIIGFSLRTNEQKFVKEMARDLKADGSRALVVAGGAHPTFFPDFVHTEGIDVVNVGEGEYSMLDLCHAVDHNEDITGIQNLVVKRNGEVHRNPLRPMVKVEDLPLLDRDIYLEHESFRRREAYDFFGSLGCPFDCAFCFIHQWNEMYKNTPGRKILRQKPVELCMREIKDLAAKIGRIPLINYADSTFNVDKPWTLEFLEAYRREIPYPFTINALASLLDEDIVKALAATGRCHMVRMGVETGNETLRRELLRKRVTNAQLMTAAELCHRHGIKFVAYNIFCLPGETFEQACETVELNIKMRPHILSPFIFHPYPGLDITRKALELGVFREEDTAKLEERQYKWFRSTLRQPDIEAVQNLCLLSPIAVHYPFTFPLVKKLARLPSNPLFQGVTILNLMDMARKWWGKSVVDLVREQLFANRAKFL